MPNMVTAIRTGAFSARVKRNAALEKLIRDGPRTFQRVANQTVNSVAFGTRDEIISTMDKVFDIRQQSFVKASMRVRTLRLSRVSGYAEVGSVALKRSDGWQAQQLGTKAVRERVATLRGRRGSRQRKIVGPARLRKNVEFLDSNRTGSGGGRRGVVRMLSQLQARKYKRPFIIHAKQHPKFQGGLYRIRGRKDPQTGLRKLQLLQGFENPNTQPRRVKWITMAWAQYVRKTSIRAVYRKAANLVGFRGALRRG